jgi:hypothetical protein
LKPNKDFKLSKEAKRRLAFILDDNQRALWKKSYIESELAEKSAKFAKLKERSNTNQGEKE